MDQKKPQNLEQLVNPYAAPCEAESIEDLYDSLNRSKKLKMFYSVLATTFLFIAPVSAFSLIYVEATERQEAREKNETIREKNEILNFIDTNYDPLFYVSAAAGIACLVQLLRYKSKVEDLELEIEIYKHDQENNHCR